MAILAFGLHILHKKKASLNSSPPHYMKITLNFMAIEDVLPGPILRLAGATFELQLYSTLFLALKSPRTSLNMPKKIICWLSFNLDT